MVCSVLSIKETGPRQGRSEINWLFLQLMQETMAAPDKALGLVSISGSSDRLTGSGESWKTKFI